jgi:hypothetical protein
MNVLSRSLVLLAIAGHMGLPAAYANTGASASGAAAQANRTGASANAGLDLLQLAQSTGGDGGSTGGAGGVGAAGGHGGGGGFAMPSYGAPSAATAGACSAGLLLPDPDAYKTPVEGLEAITEETQNYIKYCGCQSQACIADALDEYAKALDKVTLRLPPDAREVFKKLPGVVHAAATRARAAPTVRAAAGELRNAIAVVHKTIALMRASDPDAQQVATRGGDLVTGALNSAATALERADTL